MSQLRTLAPRPALALALLTSLSFAQTGPFRDGELLVQAPSSLGSGQALYRIDPETGHGAELVSGVGQGGWAGSIAFDAFRGALLVNRALPPDGPFTTKLWIVQHDGTRTALPALNGLSLRALASTGDGRVYFQQNYGYATPSQPIQYLDASDTVRTLRDAADVAPFSFSVEHLLYHAPSNSLIASTSAWWSPNDCGPRGSSLFRIPLAADGSHVAGSVLCASISDLFANEEIMALDHLPSGALLVTVASGVVSANPKLLAVDPWTLAITPFARPSQSDLNGGCYSVRRGRALILDDTANQLRAFAPGELGAGTQVVCDVPLGDGGTGFSPVESLWEIDTNGPACTGCTLGYGNGLAGSGGVVPALAIAGCPDVGVPFVIAGSQMLGGTLAALLLGPAPAAIPLLGGELCLFPIDFAFALPCDGAFGAPGAGSFALPMFAADPLLKEVSVYLQAASVDLATPEGIALSAGLRVILG